MDRPATASDELFKERSIVAEERAEEAIVAKETRVKEEVVLNKTIDERTQTVTDKVRKTKVEVEDDRTSTQRRSGKTTR